MVTNNSWNSQDPAQVAKGGTGAATLTGVLTGNGTSAVTANTVTQYGVLIGGASNAVSSTAVGSAGQVLTSNGAGMDPTYQLGVSSGGSSTDNALARWSGTGGDTLQDSTVIVTDNGEMTNASQPAFLAYLASSDANQTGDGTSFLIGDTDVGTTLTEVFDQNSDFTPGASGGAIFTAPVTGRYTFGSCIFINNLGAGHTQGNSTLITSNRSYGLNQSSPAAVRTASNNCQYNGVAITDMDAADTATLRVIVNNSTKTVGVLGAAIAYTYWSGALQC